MNNSVETDLLVPLNDNLVRILVQNRSLFQNFIKKRVSSEAAAEDILQQSFLKVVEKVDTIQNEENVVAWFFSILRNSLIDYYRSNASDAKKNAAFFQELKVSQDNGANVKELQSVVCACLNGLIATLKPDFGDLIKRIDIEEQTLDQVASDLDLTKNNLTVRLHRARQALKLSLQKTCGSCAKHACLNCTCK